MELADFVKNFVDLLEETDPKSIQPETKFRDIEEWSSLMAMSIIAMVDEKYKVKLSGNDIKNSSTLKDIYTALKAKKNV